MRYIRKIFIKFLIAVVFYFNVGNVNALTNQKDIPSGTIVPITFATSANSDRLYSGDLVI